jgi:pilus assembly protein CpaD
MKKSFTSLSRPTMVIALLAISTSLSGCMTDALDAQEMSVQPAAYSGSEAHPITVVKGPVTLEVASIESSLQPQQINAVKTFAYQARRAGVTPVTISRPSGGGASARIASEVANLMAEQGVPRKMIRVATYPGPSDAPVNVSYISTYAQTKECGDWSQDATDTFEMTHMPNHGCAVQSNIAAMLSNPGNLVVPGSSDPIRANTRVSAIKSLERDTSRDKAPWWSIF